MKTMDARPAGKRILVAENDWFSARSLARDLRHAGAAVFGPVSTLRDTLGRARDRGHTRSPMHPIAAQQRRTKAVPVYFFHRTDGGFLRDWEGTELPDLEMALVEVVQFAAGAIRDCLDYVWDGRDFRFEVADGAGVLLCTVVWLGIDTLAAQG